MKLNNRSIPRTLDRELNKLHLKGITLDIESKSMLDLVMGWIDALMLGYFLTTANVYTEHRYQQYIY